MAFPSAWTETCLVGITAKGQSAVQFVPALETIDIDSGDKDVEYIANLKGGRIEKLTPEGETTITFEGYFVELDTTSSSGMMQLFHTLSTSWDTGEPLDLLSDLGRDRFRVAIMWTDDTTVTTAEGSAGAGTPHCIRFVARECRLISAKTSFTDGMLKTTFKFKVAPRQKDGARNIMWESGDGTSPPTLTAYTTATNGF